MGFLKGKTAIITGAGFAALKDGSAGSIGYGIARAYAKEGANLVITGRNVKKLDEAKRRLEEEFGVEVLTVQADVNAGADNAAVVQNVVDRTVEKFGRIDVLVNNAGITRDGLIAKMDEASFDEVIDVNLKGTFNCCKAVTRTMMKQRSGRIVNLSSVVGVKGNAGQANYAASKAGVIGLTLALAKELAPRDITVNAIAPGFIETDMTHALGEKARASIADRIGLRRLGKPADVAHLAAFLASPEAAYITGQVICVDGGLTL